MIGSLPVPAWYFTIMNKDNNVSVEFDVANDRLVGSTMRKLAEAGCHNVTARSAGGGGWFAVSADFPGAIAGQVTAILAKIGYEGWHVEGSRLVPF